MKAAVIQAKHDKHNYNLYDKSWASERPHSHKD